MQSFTISVAMCTYNGSKYIEEQLESILGQTRLPDELIICDDGSGDDTVRKVEAFSARSPFRVTIFRNSSNLGSTANFEKAISLCNGNIIVLSDQDDVWLPHRLADTERAFIKDPSLGCVFGDGYMIDESGRATGRNLWESVNFTRLQRLQIAAGRSTLALLSRRIATGATMAFRSEVNRLSLPISPLWTHDAWIVLLASCKYRIGLLPRPVIKYRQHPQQQIGANFSTMKDRVSRARSLGIDQYDKVASQYCALRARVLRHHAFRKTAKLIDAKLRHLQSRNSLPQQRYRRIGIVLRELLTMRYTLYSTGVAGALRDLMVEAK